MKELEITVKVNSSYDKLHSDLERIGFKKIKQTIMYDTYMIDKNIDISNIKDLDILSKCIIVRNIDDYNAFIYKIKEYDEYENIISQEKIECNILDINNGIKFMKMINYKELLNIKSELIFYSNNNLDILVQIVNDSFILIEMEDDKFNNIEDMINEFSKLDIDYDKSNYFVKKAQIILNGKGDINVCR